MDNASIRETIQKCCYEDLDGDAKSIVKLLINSIGCGKQFDVNSLFDRISKDELETNYFVNIDWDAIVRIATSAKSRQETYNYMHHLK